MAKRGPKPGHIERREKEAERRGMAKGFGVSRKVSKEESLLSRNLRWLKGKPLV